MRCRAVATMATTFSATGTVKDAAGNVVPSPPPPTAIVHDVFRFVRMCRTSDDLYDSTQKLFLAFECLLCDLRPPQQLPNGSMGRQKHGSLLHWPWRTNSCRWRISHPWDGESGGLDLPQHLQR